jgi:pimeloyl-ACP methyl ester carboxylesterase
MPFVKANGIDICYESMGPPDGRPLVLIMGLTTQMIAWPDPFCRMLADDGHRVIRFDNRDSGLSSKMENLGLPDLNRLLKKAPQETDLPAPYTLSDMGRDTIGLLDGLGLPRAHICGLSMGGMIGQIMALEHPERLISLTSIMSSTGETDLPPATAEAAAALMSSPPPDRAGYQTYTAGVYRAFAGGSEAYDEALQRQYAAAAYDRGLYPVGFLRQMAAIVADGGRRKRLSAVTVPTLVIHGDCDALVPLAHGEDTARAIPRARLRVIRGLGHGLAFPALWPEMAAAIAEHTATADHRVSIQR